MPSHHVRPRAGWLAAGATVVAIVASSTLAIADKGQPVADVPPPAAMPGLPEGFRVEVGAQGVYLPKYEGSKSYELTALPVIRFRPQVSGGGLGRPGALGSFEARALDDFSFAVIKLGGFEAGPLAGWRLGRDDNDSPRLKGMGDIDGGLVAGAYVKYDFGREFLRASLHQHVSGTDTGYIVRLAAGTRLPVTAGMLLRVDLFSDIASDDYMAAYFGVSAVQAARSGQSVYNASAGFKSIGGALSTDYKLSEDWTLLATVGYSRLIGDAASSPVVETADRYEARLGLTRAIDWRWR